MGDESQQMREWTEKYGKMFNVDPHFLMAVGHIESRKGNRAFRFGRIGKSFYGPMGIHRDFWKKWDIDDPETNVMVGARALQGTGKDVMAQKKRLRRYNTAFTMSYWKEIKKAERKFAAEGFRNDG